MKPDRTRSLRPRSRRRRPAAPTSPHGRIGCRFPAACAIPPRETASASTARIARDRDGWCRPPAWTDRTSPPARSRGRETARSAPSVPPRSCGARRRTRRAGRGSGDGRSTRAAPSPARVRRQAARWECRGVPRPRRRSAPPGRRRRQSRDRSTCEKCSPRAFTFRRETPPARRLNITAQCQAQKSAGSPP